MRVCAYRIIGHSATTLLYSRSRRAKRNKVRRSSGEGVQLASSSCELLTCLLFRCRSNGSACDGIYVVSTIRENEGDQETGQ